MYHFEGAAVGANNQTSMKEHYEAVLADLHDRRWRLERKRREADVVIGGIARLIRDEPRQTIFVPSPPAVDLAQAINRLPNVNLPPFMKEHYEAELADLQERRWNLETKLSEIDVTIGGLERLIPD